LVYAGNGQWQMAGGSSVGGGTNTAAAVYATLSGGTANSANGATSTISGGMSNSASGYGSVVGGGVRNTASGQDAAIAGGGGNTASNSFATVGGGMSNTASGYLATVGGGISNTASGHHATVGGGDSNISSNNFATVGGGISNTASGQDAAIAGGGGNTASNSFATVGGGSSNTASGNYATVGGGDSNIAGGDYSFAGGNYANVRDAATAGNGTGDKGTFVWSDTTASPAAPFTSTGPNQFLIRATGGVGIQTNAPHEALSIGTIVGKGSAIELGADVAGKQGDAGRIAYQKYTPDALDIVGAGTTTSNRKITFWNEGGASFTGPATMLGTSTIDFGTTPRQMLNLYGTLPNNYGIGVQGYALYLRTGLGSDFSWFRGGTHSDARNDPGANGFEMMRLTSGGLAVNGSVTPLSDRNMKENFAEIDPAQILERVANLPIQTWNYKDDDGKVRHLGPMAQDFYAAFTIGPDDKHIATVDADGVALAAIKALKAENDALKAELAEIRRMLTNLRP
jgi:hypothetical protein